MRTLICFTISVCYVYVYLFVTEYMGSVVLKILKQTALPKGAYSALSLAQAVIIQSSLEIYGPTL